MTWEDFYDRFYDLAFSTQKSYSYKLTDYGPAEEVFEVIYEFTDSDQKFATRFAEKAFAAGVRFTPEQVLDLTTLIDKGTLSKMAEHTSIPFTKEQLEEVYMLIDDGVFERICKKLGVDIFEEEDDNLEEDYEYDFSAAYIQTPPKKLGFFGTLFAIVAGFSMASNSNKRKHSERCDGNCANCPLHFGYRYGRWYYGRGHVRGCRFGGNRV